MLRSVSIATLMAPFAGGAFILGYSTAEMAEIVAFGGSRNLNYQSAPDETAYSIGTHLHGSELDQVALTTAKKSRRFRHR